MSEKGLFSITSDVTKKRIFSPRTRRIVRNPCFGIQNFLMKKTSWASFALHLHAKYYYHFPERRFMNFAWCSCKTWIRPIWDELFESKKCEDYQDVLAVLTDRNLYGRTVRWLALENAKGKIKKLTMVLEEIGDCEFWIWGYHLGKTVGLNEFHILDSLTFFVQILYGKMLPNFPFLRKEKKNKRL